MRVQRPFSRNSFAPLLHVAFRNAGESSYVDLSLRMHLGVRGGLGIWFTGALVGPLGAATVAYVQHSSRGLAGFASALLSLPLAAAGYGVVRLGQRHARKDGEDMVALVRATLDAREAT
jgi:hypothetical protein